MHTRYLSVIVLAATAAVTAPAFATDTSSLSAFLATCSSDTKGCKAFAHDLMASAKSAHYGCVPKALSAEDAGDQLLAWMKGPAQGNAKYEKMSLEDAMWEGVDTLWPCKGK